MRKTRKIFSLAYIRIEGWCVCEDENIEIMGTIKKTAEHESGNFSKPMFREDIERILKRHMRSIVKDLNGCEDEYSRQVSCHR